ncbi:MAG: PAS domain S-box protein [Polyangiaceae bacterium]|nr:PAS domain S-box protein [Polyangiaceae bacterium]
MSTQSNLTPDFRRIFESAPGCYLVLAPDLTIVAVSDAYLNATMTRRDDILGRGLFDVFPDNPDDPAATGVANLRTSLERVLARRRPDTMALQKYDIRRPDSEGGGFEERHWSPVNTPVLGDDGEVLYIIHRVEDVTEYVLLLRHESEQDRTIQEMTVRSEERYSQLLDAAPDAMVVVGGDGRITLVNRQAEALFGYSRAELIGKPHDVLIPEGARAAHEHHASGYFASPKTRAMGTGIELFGRRKDGSLIPIEVSLSPIRTGDAVSVSAAFRDISERKRMEMAARLNADRLASAIESIQDALVLFDATDRLVLCNSAYRRLMTFIPGPLTGRPFEDVLTAWMEELVLPDESERARFLQSRLAERSKPTGACDVRTRDGRCLRIMDRRTPEGGLVTTIWDLTDDVRQAEELRQARAAADVASAAKSEFLSSMSHELRTPLNAILGFAQLLQRDKKEPLSDRHRARVEQILTGGGHLRRLIDDVLDLARIEAGRVSISPEPVHVKDVLEQVKTTLDPVAARADVSIHIAPLPADVPTIVADRTRFTQILMNYGTNAIKYNRPGGTVTFILSLPAPERLRVTVADNGAGIALDKQDKLFQPFQRAGQETGSIEGTGIGLTITKRLAELMCGTVGFRSVPSEGSDFWVEMPIHMQSHRASEAPEVGESARLDANRRGLILYVEDNPANITFMRDLLDAFEGIELAAAPTAEIGLELARSRRPDVILMDINLPGISGLDALHILREWPETREIPVIALTAAASERDRLRGEQEGFYRYLTKPVNVDELEAALEALLAASDAG